MEVLTLAIACHEGPRPPVLRQVAMTAKSNEIPAVRDLLNAFTDLAGAVITIDALTLLQTS
jgi:hypothetical protein